jgi:hypothetical protein
MHVQDRIEEFEKKHSRDTKRQVTSAGVSDSDDKVAVWITGRGMILLVQNIKIGFKTRRP